jgi:hypothetical protein
MTPPPLVSSAQAGGIARALTHHFQLISNPTPLLSARHARRFPKLHLQVEFVRNAVPTLHLQVE